MKNQNPGLPRLRVSENGRFLITEDKTPFFWLGDTAWELFHRSRHEEAEIYLKNRQAKKFTVVQAVALAEFDGVTYGHHSMWQMASPRYPTINHAKMTWTEALDRPGASQVKHLRALMESRPFITRIPDQSMLIEGSLERSQFVCVTRDINGRYAFAYLPLPSPVTVDLGKLDAGQVNVWWYNPRTGGATLEGKFSGGTFQTFTPPKNGPDWVLVVDDVFQAYQPPGVGRAY